jgi:hypothetical protein
MPVNETQTCWAGLREGPTLNTIMRNNMARTNNIEWNPKDDVGRTGHQVFSLLLFRDPKKEFTTIVCTQDRLASARTYCIKVSSYFAPSSVSRCENSFSIEVCTPKCYTKLISTCFHLALCQNKRTYRTFRLISTLARLLRHCGRRREGNNSSTLFGGLKAAGCNSCFSSLFLWFCFSLL